jgi:hypothetical protein
MTRPRLPALLTLRTLGAFVAVALLLLAVPCLALAGWGAGRAR